LTPRQFFTQKSNDIWPISIGVLCLLFNVSIYFSDRPPDQTHFVVKLHFHQSFTNDIPRIFAPLGNCLLAFLHTTIFSLITVRIIAVTKRDHVVHLEKPIKLRQSDIKRIVPLLYQRITALFIAIEPSFFLMGRCFTVQKFPQEYLNGKADV
jgi:hypothetical protein